MLFKIKFIVIGVLLITTVTLGYLYKREIKHAAMIAQELMQAQVVLVETQDKLKEEREERERVEKVLKTREDAYRKLRSESLKLRKDLEGLRQSDEKVMDWSNQLVPDSIRIRLHPEKNISEN